MSDDKLSPEEIAAIAKARAERDAERAALKLPKTSSIELLRPALSADPESEAVKAWQRQAPPENVREWYAERASDLARKRLQQEDGREANERLLEESKSKREEEVAKAARDSSRKRYDSAMWSVWEALAWIAFRDPERLSVINSRIGLLAVRKFSDKDLPMKEPDPAALLRDALEAGKVLAFKDGQPLPRQIWAGKAPWDIAGVWFEAPTIRKQWPDDTKPEQRPPLGAAAAETFARNYIGRELDAQRSPTSAGCETEAQQKWRNVQKLIRAAFRNAAREKGLVVRPGRRPKGK